MAALPIIVVGDKTSHGGVVITGDLTSDINGKAIARVGDKVTCPKRGCPSNTVIATGDPTLTFDGKAVARHGDKTACGATLIASQSFTTDDFGGGGSTTAPARSDETAPQTSAATAAPQTTGFNQHIRFVDSLTGVPIEDQTFVLFSDGEVLLNKTSELGLSDLINTGNTSKLVTYELKGIMGDEDGK